MAILWTERTAAGNYTGNLRGIAYGASLWVAVGDQGEIQSSPDGSTWTQRTPAGGYAGQFNAVAWSPTLSLFVAVGAAGELQSSPDGITWTQRTPAGGFGDSFLGVAWANDRFIAVGRDTTPDPDEGVIQTSADGITWTARASDPPLEFRAAVYGGGEYVVGGDIFDGSSGCNLSNDGSSFFASGGDANTGAGFAVDALAHHDGLVAALSPTALGPLIARLYSTANPLGGEWDLRASSTSEQFLALIGGEDGWVIVAGDGTTYTRFWESEDGLSWEAGEDTYEAVLSSVAYSGGRWVAVGAGGAIYQGTSYVPPDRHAEYLAAYQSLLPEGPAWTREVDAVLTDVLRALTDEAARIDQRARDLLEETDSRTATELLDDYFRESALPGPCDAPVTTKEKREYLHAHRLGDGDPNRQFWIDLLQALGLTGVELTNRHEPFAAGSAAGDPLSNDEWQFTFVLRHDSGGDALNSRAACKVIQLRPLHTHALVVPHLYTSWEVIPTTGATYRGVAQDGASFVAVGDGDRIRRSTDLGLSWEELSTGVAANLTAVAAFGPDNFVLVGNNGRIHRSTDGGATWGAAETVTGTPTFNSVAWDEVDDVTTLVAVGNAGAIHTGTTGGTTWTARTPAGGFAGAFHGIAAHAARWVAVGASGEIQYSTDGGVTWQQAIVESTALALRAVLWHQHNWYAAGDDGLFMTSRDGIVWSIVVNDVDAQDLVALCSLEGDAILVGSTQVAAVPDHRVWDRASSKYELHTRDTGATDAIRGAAYLDDVLVTVGGVAQFQRALRA